MEWLELVSQSSGWQAFSEQGSELQSGIGMGDILSLQAKQKVQRMINNIVFISLRFYWRAKPSSKVGNSLLSVSLKEISKLALKETD